MKHSKKKPLKSFVYTEFCLKIATLSLPFIIQFFIKPTKKICVRECVQFREKSAKKI